MSDFWTSLSILAPTPASKLPVDEQLPYLDLNGSITNNPLLLQAGANTLFPLLDQTLPGGTVNSIPVVADPSTAGQTIPANFNLAPSSLSPEDFLSWHTDFQIQYYEAHLGNTNSDGTLTIGPAPAVNQITIIPATPVQEEVNTSAGALTTVGVIQNVFVLQDLQKSDFASMSLADQALIAGTDFFKNTLSTSLGLIPSNTPQSQITPFADLSSLGLGSPPLNAATAVSGRTTAITTSLSSAASVDVSTEAKALAAMNDAISGTEIQILNDYIAAQTTAAGATIALNTTDVQVFINELENIRNQINGSGGLQGQKVFSPQDIETSLTTIYTRWTRVKAFGSVIPETENTTYNNPDETENVISQDGGAGVNNAYSTFMNAEKRILALDNSSLAAASTGVLANRQLDVPNLIAIFQLYANLTDEQINLGNTEEISQTNDLLTTYGVMQQIINATLQKFDSTNTSEYLAINGTSVSKDNGDSSNPLITSVFPSGSAQLKVVEMFEDALGTGQLNPIEAMNGIKRPTIDSIYNSNGTINKYLQQQWNTFGTELSDTVTLLNQNSQIQENNVTELQKEQDNHFDLANTALSKATDIIQTIGRNVSD